MALADFPRERFSDHVHATGGLEHGGLELMQGKTLEISPEPGLQDLRQFYGLAGDRGCT